MLNPTDLSKQAGSEAGPRIGPGDAYLMGYSEGRRGQAKRRRTELKASGWSVAEIKKYQDGYAEGQWKRYAPIRSVGLPVGISRCLSRCHSRSHVARWSR